MGPSYGIQGTRGGPMGVLIKIEKKNKKTTTAQQHLDVSRKVLTMQCTCKCVTYDRLFWKFTIPNNV